MENAIQLDIRERVAWITIARPQSLNALDVGVLRSLAQAVEAVQKASVRCSVIIGAGDRAFVAGADIGQMVDLEPPAAFSFAREGQRVFQAIEELPSPVIAAVNGYALGGGLELALACDLVVAADNAQLGQPEITLGVVPGFGGTQRLIRRVGPGAARWLIFTGKRISAVEASRLGLVDLVVPAGELVERVEELAKDLASRPYLALQQAKALLRLALDVPLAQGLEAEASAFALCFAHPDRQEGMRAFLEKRRPRFS